MQEVVLDISDRSERMGRWLEFQRVHRTNTYTIGDTYGLFKFRVYYDQMQRLGEESHHAFITALVSSCKPKTRKLLRRDYCGMYCWWRNKWLPRRYNSLLSQIKRLNKQIQKANLTREK